jgi:hypothetical protein
LLIVLPVGLMLLCLHAVGYIATVVLHVLAMLH